MGDQHNNAARVLFQFLILAAVVGLIISVGRLTMTETERAGDFFGYNLNQNSQINSFIFTILLSILALGVGAFTYHSYRFIATPMISAGVLMMIYATLIAYFQQYFTGIQYADATNNANAVFTVAIALEWVGLFFYCWYYDVHNRKIASPSQPQLHHEAEKPSHAEEAPKVDPLHSQTESSQSSPTAPHGT